MDSQFWQYRIPRSYMDPIMIAHFSFLSWVANTQLNHCTKRMVSTRIITYYSLTFANIDARPTRCG